MNSVIHRAIELNNLGAARLNTQDLGDAMGTFREGLAYLKNNSSDDHHAADFLGVSTSLPQLGDGPFLLPVEKLEQDPTIMPNSCVTVRAYYFDHPLLLDGTADIPAVADILCLTYQISAVLLFNLALAHHWMGMQLARADLHRSAVRLYNTAHNLLKALEEESMGQPLPPESGFNYSFFNMLKLLSMNNMAQICYDELGDYEQMTVALSSMQRMIVDEWPLFSRSVRTARLVSEEDATSLMINAKMLKVPYTAGAA